MENFDLNKLYYDKDGVKLYGHDMLRLAINHLFIKQRTGVLKYYFWSVFLGIIGFIQFYFIFSPAGNVNLNTLPFWAGVLSGFICFIGVISSVVGAIPLLIYGVSFLSFTQTHEYKKRSSNLNFYHSAYRFLRKETQRQLICKAKQTILNTTHIRQEFERQYKKLSAVVTAVNQTTSNISPVTNSMAYTAHQQVYSGFDSLNFGNNNNKNKSMI